MTDKRRLQCPNCNTVLNVDSRKLIGKQCARCPRCRHKFPLPTADSISPPGHEPAAATSTADQTEMASKDNESDDDSLEWDLTLGQTLCLIPCVLLGFYLFARPYWIYAHTPVSASISRQYEETPEELEVRQKNEQERRQKAHERSAQATKPINVKKDRVQEKIGQIQAALAKARDDYPEFNGTKEVCYACRMRACTRSESYGVKHLFSDDVVYKTLRFCDSCRPPDEISEVASQPVSDEYREYRGKKNEYLKGLAAERQPELDELKKERDALQTRIDALQVIPESKGGKDWSLSSAFWSVLRICWIVFSGMIWLMCVAIPWLALASIMGWEDFNDPNATKQ